MSDLHKLRREKNCLNCGADVEGKYCSECGQLNREPQMGVNDLIHEVLHSILHFDGKFFETIRVLITKPGFLTTEYISGKRSKYLPPVQMYLFTSAIFFFLLYTFFIQSPSLNEKAEVVNNNEVENNFKIDINDSLAINSIEEYEKEQATLTDDKKDGILKHFFWRKILAAKEKYKNDNKKAFFDLIDVFIHSFSSLFFVSLPLIALLLNLIFFKKKEINLVGHFIFITHNFIFDFVLLFANILLKIPASVKGWEFVQYIAMLAFVWIIYYGYKSMKNFYQLSRGNAILNYFFAITGSLFIYIVLFIIYLLISFLKIT